MASISKNRDLQILRALSFSSGPRGSELAGFPCLRRGHSCDHVRGGGRGGCQPRTWALTSAGAPGRRASYLLSAARRPLRALVFLLSTAAEA